MGLAFEILKVVEEQDLYLHHRRDRSQISPAMVLMPARGAMRRNRHRRRVHGGRNLARRQGLGGRSRIRLDETHNLSTVIAGLDPAIQEAVPQREP